MLMLKADNRSKGFWDKELELLKQYGIGKECCLVAENSKVEPFLKGWFPNTTFSFLGYDEADCSKYEYDMNRPFNYGKEFDSVLSQALLEHVCRPSIAVENMVNLVKPGGVVVIHTVMPGFQVHRHPIDCVRFLPDFWKSLTEYIPATLIEYSEYGYHVFVTYRRSE